MDKGKNAIKKVWETLHSMGLGIILLIIIGVLSILGSIIPQGNSVQFYEINYGSFTYDLIKTFHLHDVFHSWWFTLLMGVLSINLILCSIRRLPLLIKAMKKNTHPEFQLQNVKKWEKIEIEKNEIEDFFRKMKFKKVHEEETKRGKVYYSYKHSIGYFGSWLTHLGLLLIILFFAFGKINGFEAFIHGVPGVVEEIEGTEFSIAIKDFNINYREDFSVEQYISQIDIMENNEVIDQGEVLVNHPFRTEHLNVYQNATGWAVDVNLYKNGEEYREKTMYQGEFFVEDDQKIALQFVEFYPDLDHSAQGLRNRSPFPNHPVMLYALFYDGYRVDMNLVHMGEEIGFEEYKFHIDNPQMFTLLQVVRDPGLAGAFVGGVLLTVGIVLAMYRNPKKLIIYLGEEGKGRVWGKSHKNNQLYREEIELAIKDIHNKSTHQ